jgi:spore coat polysaccharide biosynthesis protein SpsF
MCSDIFGIVQARMGSTRLPGKTLLEIKGRPLLEHIILRVKHSREMTGLAVATTSDAMDDPIRDLCARLDVPVYRGSSEDVLDRYYQCALKYGAGIIVRITADDPFKDPLVIDLVIREMLSGSYDYVSNTIRPTFPEGLDVEVFSFEALERAWHEAGSQLQREHVTPYIWLNPGRFRLKNIENQTDLSHLRWTLDTKEDLDFARSVYDQLYQPGELFLMEDVLGLLKRRPELQKINKGVEQYSGFKKISGEHN